MAEQGAAPAEETDVRIETAQQTGASIVYFGTADRLLAVIVINDTLKATTPPALDQLRRLHIDIAMLTGDSRKTAAALAERLGIRPLPGRSVARRQRQIHPAIAAGR